MQIKKYLELIPQSAVKQCFIDEPGYNAAWDYHITPNGRHFIPCCAEGTFPEFVKLYEYLPKTNEMKMHFSLDKVITVYPRTIRPSKFHTCINTMPDGKLIMTSHTTACAPNHPCNMPEAYYTHMWEGFMGSNVLIYDPETGKLEDLGIPVPRDTIYGAKYLPEQEALFFTTYLRGHGYLFDLKTRTVKDYGQLTEFGAYHLAEASDGNLYFTTRSGVIWRFNTKTLEPECTGVEIPKENGNYVKTRNVMAYSITGPDGRLYFVPHFGCRFYAYDPKTNQIETLAWTVPAALREQYPAGFVFGMAFDEEGMLWYTCEARMLRLCRIDIMNPNAEAEQFGIIGTEKRAHRNVESIHLRDGILYMSETNHGADLPGVVSVDLKELLEHKDEPRVICQDPMLYIQDETAVDEEFYRGNVLEDGENILAFNRLNKQDKRYIAENPFHFGKGKRYVCKLWKRFGTEGSQVKDISYDEQGRVQAFIEANGGTVVTVRDGELLESYAGTFPPKDSQEEIAKRFASYVLPAHPGRQFLAKASAWCELEDGQILVGTKDGMLALIRNNKVFRLGAVCNDGPVRDIAASPDGKRAFGVGGDPDSLGVVFSYDVDTGVTLEGAVYFSDGAGSENCGVSCEPCCIAFSPDGKRVAIGVRDNLGCVYEFEV